MRRSGLLLVLLLAALARPLRAGETILGTEALAFSDRELEAWALERARAHDFPGIECAFCHSNEGLRLSLRTPDGRVRDFYVDPTRAAQSIHDAEGMTDCTDCHDDSCMACEEPSHLASCFDCHDEEDTEQADARDSVAQSVHADFIRGKCAACHNPHYMKSSRDMTLEEKNRGCLYCHEDRSGDQLDPLVLRHEWHPQASLHLATIACIACHTRPDESEPAAFKHRILASKQAARECTECHAPGGRLRSYLVDIGEEAKADLSVDEMLAQFYVSGVTDDPRVDRAGLAILSLVILGAAAHGLLRIATGGRR